MLFLYMVFHPGLLCTTWSHGSKTTGADVASLLRLSPWNSHNVTCTIFHHVLLASAKDGQSRGDPTSSWENNHTAKCHYYGNGRSSLLRKELLQRPADITLNGEILSCACIFISEKWHCSSKINEKRSDRIEGRNRQFNKQKLETSALAGLA